MENQSISQRRKGDIVYSNLNIFLAKIFKNVKHSNEEVHVKKIQKLQKGKIN